MKVLFLPVFSITGASSRYRVYQYLSGLNEHGIKTKVIERPGRNACSKLIHLARVLVTALFADAVFIQKRTLGRAICLVWLVNRNIIYDLDDAIYTHPTLVKMSQSELQRTRADLARTLRLSKHVIVGNRYLKTYVEQYNRQVTVIPTVIDTVAYRPEERQPSEPVIIGWVGSSVNLFYLEHLNEVFCELANKYGNRISLKVISDGQARLTSKIATINQQWKLETEIEDLRGIDIGIMPLVDDEWTRGKCGFKALQYMALGIPVVASPVGMSTEIIEDGINGFLAESDAEWIEKLSRLIEDKALRHRLGAKGRETVENRYSLKIALPTLIAVLEDVACSEHEE